MCSFEIWALFTECNLDARRTPGDEICEFAFTDALETLVYLRWVNLPLNDIKDGDIAALLQRSRDHDVFCLKKPPHNVKNGCLLHSTSLQQSDAMVRQH